MQTTFLQSPTHQLECLNVVDEIIDGMDDSGILELMSGSGGDIDKVLEMMDNGASLEEIEEYLISCGC